MSVKQLIKKLFGTSTAELDWDDAYWCQRVEQFIRANSGPVFTRGKFKGHSLTDTQAWQHQLVTEINDYIAANYRGRYDENMLASALLGRVLVVWYCNVHRAKSLDPNRPVSLRRKAYNQVTGYRSQLWAATTDDRIMSAVWKNQKFDNPFSKYAKNGKFK